MNPVTAILFIFIGLSFFFLTAQSGFFQHKGIGKIIAAVVIIISSLRLISEVFNLNILVDTLLFNEQLRTDTVKNISSRMAGGSALNFILTGIALFFLNSEKGKILAAQLIAILMGLMGMLFIVGYLYHVNTLHSTLIYFPMAIHTAICFVIIAVAFLFASPDRFFRQPHRSLRQPHRFSLPPMRSFRLSRLFLSYTIFILPDETCR